MTGESRALREVARQIAQRRAALSRPSTDNRDPPIPPPSQQMLTREFAVEDTMTKGQGGVSIKIGKAYRRRPMIDILADKGLLTANEHKALRHYRHHADIADRSPMRDSLCLHRSSGRGDGPTVTTLNAIRVRSDCERAAGSLTDILRAVVVYDQSLSEWAIERHGGLEEREVRKGRASVRIKPRRRALNMAQLDIRMAAKRVEAELAA